MDGRHREEVGLEVFGMVGIGHNAEAHAGRQVLHGEGYFPFVAGDGLRRSDSHHGIDAGVVDLNRSAVVLHSIVDADKGVSAGRKS